MLIIILFVLFFAGFDIFAKYGMFGKRLFLVYNGYRYYRNRQIGSNTHWRCATYKQTLCKGRATTKVISGVEMMRINAPHSHSPEPYHR